MPAPPKLRQFQFRLLTVMMVVTVAGILSGSIRWLFILVGGPVAVYVLVALFLVAVFARACSGSFWLWRKWDRIRARRMQARQCEAMRLLVESEDVKEAIRAVEGGRSQNPDSAAAKQV